MRTVRILLWMLLGSLVNPTSNHAQTLVNPELTRKDGTWDQGIRAAVPSQEALQTDTEKGARTPAESAAATVEKWMRAERYARQHPEEFLEAVQFRAARPRLADLRTDEPARAAALAVLVQDPEAFRAEVNGLTDLQRQEVNADAVALRRMAEAALADRGNRVVVFADGNIRGALDDDDATEANSGTGALGVAVSTGVGQWTARINIASSEQLVSTDYGAIILAPGTGRSLASGLLDVRLAEWPVHLYGSVSNSRWKLGTADDAPTANATVLGVGALYTRKLASGSLDDNLVVLTAEVGGALRWLDGDIRRFEDERVTVLGSPGSFFGGPEAGFTVGLGRVTGQVQVYSLFEVGNASRRIPGLNGLQVVAGLGVTGEMFSGWLR